MRAIKRVAVVVAALGVALATTMASAGAGTQKWTNFGPGTGVQAVTYNGFTSYMSKSGSGIVEQWISPTDAPPYGAYYLFKPLTYAPLSVTTPFQESCDSLGLVGSNFPAEWFYNSGNYTPAGILTPYFPVNGEEYWVCQYDLYSHAQGSLTFDAFGVNNRQVNFAVHTGSVFGPAGGTLNYSDTDGSYTANITAVTITGTTVAFSGQITSWSQVGSAWPDITNYYVTYYYDQTAGTFAGAWGATMPLTAGANYPTTSSTVAIYVR